MSIFVWALVALAAGAGWWRVLRDRGFRREAYIREFELPKGLFEQLRKKRPSLTAKDCQLVAHALRQFFLAHLKSGRAYVSMPSQVVDDLWHEFILHTRNYQVFCNRAFGRFLHHTPAVAVGGSAQASAGLRRCWWYACKEEHINPRSPTRLPLLFAIDAKLGVVDGFRYALDCKSAQPVAQSNGDGATPVYCGAELASGGDFGVGGCGGGSADASDGGGGSGCGGGGCGGGGD